jgi:DivIVA domain-containing protein
MAGPFMPDQSSAATEHAILQEITRPLEALPDDALSIINADFPMALRGYDRVAVDDYVRRTRQLVAELQATRSPEAAVRRALERVGEEITGILQRAHETAEQITVQSRREAEDRLEQARLEAGQVAASAEQRVRELDADTDRIWLERQRIVSDAEELAAQLLALAKTASERFPADGEAAGPPAATAGDRDEAPIAPPPASFADEADEEYYEDIVYHDAESESAEDGDVEETVAFQPLTPSGDDLHEAGTAEEGPHAGEEATAETASDAEDATAERNPAEEPTAERGAPGGTSEEPTADGHPTSDDTTAVIPPASQAASRKLNP